jgi:hypothetical protein
MGREIDREGGDGGDVFSLSLSLSLSSELRSEQCE